MPSDRNLTNDDDVIWLTPFQQKTLALLQERLSDVDIGGVRVGGRPSQDRLAFGHDRLVLIVVLTFVHAAIEAWIYDVDAMFTGASEEDFEREDYKSDEALATDFVDSLVRALSKSSVPD